MSIILNIFLTLLINDWYNQNYSQLLSTAASATIVNSNNNNDKKFISKMSNANHYVRDSYSYDGEIEHFSSPRGEKLHFGFFCFQNVQT